MKVLESFCLQEVIGLLTALSSQTIEKDRAVLGKFGPAFVQLREGDELGVGQAFLGVFIRVTDIDQKGGVLLGKPSLGLERVQVLRTVNGGGRTGKGD
jgi:hypothetical protein